MHFTLVNLWKLLIRYLNLTIRYLNFECIRCPMGSPEMKFLSQIEMNTGISEYESVKLYIPILYLRGYGSVHMMFERSG